MFDNKSHKLLKNVWISTYVHLKKSLLLLHIFLNASTSKLNTTTLKIYIYIYKKQLPKAFFVIFVIEIFPLTSNIPLFCLNVVLSFREGCRAWYDFSDCSKSSLSQYTSERQQSTPPRRGLALNLWLFVMQNCENHFVFPFTGLPSPCAGPPSPPGEGEQTEIVFRGGSGH